MNWEPHRGKRWEDAMRALTRYGRDYEHFEMTIERPEIPEEFKPGDTYESFSLGDPVVTIKLSKPRPAKG